MGYEFKFMQLGISRVERRRENRSVGDHAIDLPGNFFHERSFAVGVEPQAKEMAFPVRFGPVFIVTATVISDMAIHIGDITRLQFDFEGNFSRQRLKHLHGFYLRFGQIGNTGQFVTAQHGGTDTGRGKISVFDTEYGLTVPRLRFTDRNFAVSASIEGPIQFLRQVGSAFQHFIVKCY